MAEITAANLPKKAPQFSAALLTLWIWPNTQYSFRIMYGCSKHRSNEANLASGFVSVCSCHENYLLDRNYRNEEIIFDGVT